jgi:hypothetical protein
MLVALRISSALQLMTIYHHGLNGNYKVQLRGLPSALLSWMNHDESKP